jgi:superfamily II DNA or RNA helicase
MMTTPTTYTARDYQIAATDAALDGFFTLGHRRQLTVLPTGTGKTVVFSLLRNHPRVVEWLQTFRSSEQRMLVLAHREELLDQAAAKIAASNPELSVEVEQADRRATMFADVVVASVASLVRRLDRFRPADFRICVVDEAHHAAASTYVKIMQHFEFLPDPELPSLGVDPSKMLLGFTATAKRGDDVALDHVFERVSYAGELRWFIERGYLAPLVGRLVETTISLDAVKTVDGDFNQRQLAETVNTTQRNEQIVKAWLEHARTRPTLAFTVDIAHAHDLARTYQTAGITALAISGETPKQDRRNALEAFRERRVDVLTNCNVLTEGTDLPLVSCIVHGRPTKSQLLYIQMTGRGTRPSPATGKADCLVLDCVDIASKHSLVTIADLAGLPPCFDLKGRDAMKAKRELDELRAANPLVSLVGARSFDDVAVRVRDLDLWKAPELPPLLQKHAALAWVPSFDGESFTLLYPTGNVDAQNRKIEERVDVTVDQLGHWTIAVDGVALPLAPAPSSADAALTAAEQWVKTNRPHVLRLLDSTAKWRRDPATENQLRWLKKKRVPHDPATISKGEASRLLDIAFGRGK